MTTSLQDAKDQLSKAEWAYEKSEQEDGSPYWRSRSERHYQQAAAYAAIAQAEALTRLAEVAETLLEAKTLQESAAVWGL